jgi:cyclohexadienyl dehydratase
MTTSAPDATPLPCSRARRRLAILVTALCAVIALLSPACATRPPLPARTAARELRVGTSGDYPPFTELRDGQASGFSAALMEAYASERGHRLVWVRFRWSDLVTALAAGQFDLAESGITVRPDRSLVGRFTVPVTRNGAVLLLRRPAWAQALAPAGEDPLATLKRLDRPELTVGVNRGGHLERVARAHFQNARIVAIPDNAAVREALHRGEVDAALTNTVEAPRWAEGLSNLERIGPFTRDVVAVYVSAKEPELAADLDRWLLAREENGTLSRLRARHLGASSTERTAQPVDALLAATAERLALMPLVAAAKHRAGEPIEVPAQEARVLEAARVEVRKAADAEGLTPPPDAAITSFFQAQMEAAKAVQRRTPAPAAEARVPSLDDELRPALARISARMSALLPRIPPGLDRETAVRKTRDYLGGSGLEHEELERIAETLRDVSARSQTAPSSGGDRPAAP